MDLRIFNLVGLVVVLPIAGCATGHYAQTGTVGGGLTGGAIGALAGAPGDRSLEGAAIGAVAGSVLGNVAGELADRDAANANAQNQACVQQARSRAVTTNQVIQMSQSGVGDQLIINQLQSDGVIGPLSTNDMIALKQSGVSDNVITAWQQTPVAGTIARVASVQPIVVEPFIEQAYGPDCRYFRRPHHRYGLRHWH